LVDEGVLRGTILDVGCGTGEHALAAAARGFAAVGVDSSPRAIALAKAKAAERGIDAEFVVEDALDLPALGRIFDTVFDCGLFHVFDDDDRTRYVRSLNAAVAPGGRFHMLCFSDLVPPGFGPRRIGRDEIRESFADGWIVVTIEPARQDVLFTSDGIPAWLATIERAGDRARVHPSRRTTPYHPA